MNLVVMQAADEGREVRFFLPAFSGAGNGGHKQPGLHSDSKVESDLPSNRLPQTNSKNL